MKINFARFLMMFCAFGALSFALTEATMKSKCLANEADFCLALAQKFERKKDAEAEQNYLQHACAARSKIGCEKLGELAGKTRSNWQRISAQQLLEAVCEGGFGAACFVRARLAEGKNEQICANYYELACLNGSAEGCVLVANKQANLDKSDEFKAAGAFLLACANGASEICEKIAQAVKAKKAAKTAAGSDAQSAAASVQQSEAKIHQPKTPKTEELFASDTNDLLRNITAQTLKIIQEK